MPRFGMPVLFFLLETQTFCLDTLIALLSGCTNDTHNGSLRHKRVLVQPRQADAKSKCQDEEGSKKTLDVGFFTLPPLLRFPQKKHT